MWWNWTAPSSGTLTIATTTSTFDTLLGIYTGSVVGSLARMGSNDDESASVRTSRVSISVVARTTYRIAVDGYGGEQGAIRLAGTFQPELVLAAPVGLNALRDTRNRVDVSWSAVSGATRYEVSLFNGSTVYASRFLTGTSTRTSGAIPIAVSLSAKVRAFSASGVAGPWSATVLVR